MYKDIKYPLIWKKFCWETPTFTETKQQKTSILQRCHTETKFGNSKAMGVLLQKENLTCYLKHNHYKLYIKEKVLKCTIQQKSSQFSLI